MCLAATTARRNQEIKHAKPTQGSDVSSLRSAARSSRAFRRSGLWRREDGYDHDGATAGGALVRADLARGDAPESRRDRAGADIDRSAEGSASEGVRA